MTVPPLKKKEQRDLILIHREKTVDTLKINCYFTKTNHNTHNITMCDIWSNLTNMMKVDEGWGVRGGNA